MMVIAVGAGIVLVMHSKPERTSPTVSGSTVPRLSPPAADRSNQAAAQSQAMAPAADASAGEATRNRSRKRDVFAQALHDADPVQLIQAARQDDAEVQVELSARLLSCKRLRTVIKPNGPIRPNQKGTELGQECVDLESKLAGAELSPDYWRDRAAESGHGPALMMQALDPEFGDSAERKAAFRAAFSSRDPAVLVQTTLMASQDKNYREQQRPLDSKSSLTLQNASMLALCDRGTDCSRDGPLFKAICGNNGVGCEHAENLARVIELRMSPAQFRETQEAATRLQKDFAGPVEDSPEAQAVMRSIDQPSK